MKKLLIVLALSINANATISTHDKPLPVVVSDNMFCVGYNQAMYENTALNTPINTEAEAAMQYFYDRGFKLNTMYNVDDGEPESDGGKDTDKLNKAYSLGYANYMFYKKPMPEMCFSVYSKAVKNMSTSELTKPYK